MRRALPLVVLSASLLLALVPSSSAQDPGEVVALLCDATGNQLPVCPQQDPQPAQPAAPAQEAAPQPQADPAQDPAGAAGSLAADAQDAVQGSAQDPASAPDRIVGLLATLVQMVKDLLGLPVTGVVAAWDASVEGILAAGDAIAAGATAASDAATGAYDATAGAVTGAFDAVGGAMCAAWSAVAGLFASEDATVDASAPAAGDLPVRAPDAKGLLDDVVGALPKA